MPISPRKTVLQMQAYPAPDEGRYPHARLDFNENTVGFPDAYPGGMPPETVSAYPEYGQLLTKLSGYYSIPPQSISLTNGSDEALLVTALTFIEPGGNDIAVLSKPCFVVMTHSLKLAGATLREVPTLEDMSFDIAGIESALDSGARLAMFATPENPTGKILEENIILKWCEKYPDTLFVIDEAYGEFANITAVPHVVNTPNLVVLKTFSKAWGMAGLRLGVIFASPQIINYINCVKMPYSVNSAAVYTASRLLDRSEEVLSAAAATMRRKEALQDKLTSRGYRLVAGASNGFLLGLGMAAIEFVAFARKRGVLVRNRSESVFPGPNKSKTWGYVRVSAGTEAENQRFLDVLLQFERSFGVLLDLDGTLVDTSESFDRTICELVLHHSESPLGEAELCSLRAEGGYNDDWVATHELIRRRGKDVPIADIVEQASKRYLQLAPEVEKLMCAELMLTSLQARHPMFIVTGRPRPEYDPVWSSKLEPFFRQVYCVDDVPGKLPKPSPDYLTHALEEHEIHAGIYVGNSVDDMQAARAAGLYAIGVATTLSSDVLESAGAHIVYPSIEMLAEVFML